MSRWITTAAECYADGDKERACAQITRVGGGAYRMTPLYGHVADADRQRTYPTEADAVAAAEAFAAGLDELDPVAFQRAHAIHEHRISGLVNEVAELRALLAKG